MQTAKRFMPGMMRRPLSQEQYQPVSESVSIFFDGALPSRLDSDRQPSDRFQELILLVVACVWRNRDAAFEFTRSDQPWLIGLVVHTFDAESKRISAIAARHLVLSLIHI